VIRTRFTHVVIQLHVFVLRLEKLKPLLIINYPFGLFLALVSLHVMVHQEAEGDLLLLVVFGIVVLPFIVGHHLLLVVVQVFLVRCLLVYRKVR